MPVIHLFPGPLHHVIARSARYVQWLMLGALLPTLHQTRRSDNRCMTTEAVQTETMTGSRVHPNVAPVHGITTSTVVVAGLATLLSVHSLVFWLCSCVSLYLFRNPISRTTRRASVMPVTLCHNLASGSLSHSKNCLTPGRGSCPPFLLAFVSAISS